MARPFWCRKDWIWKIIHSQVKEEHLLPLLLILNKMLPEPTREDCHLENSRVLCDVRDEFFRRLKLGGERRDALRAIWNFGIIMHEHDEPYRDLMDWSKAELEKYSWEPLAPNSPTIQIFKRDWQLEKEKGECDALPNSEASRK